MHSQSSAKRYFVDKIVQQAHSEGVTLSEAERRMLSWSESDPEFAVDPQLVARLASEMSDQEYERKIIGLLERCFAEQALNPESRAMWEAAYTVLNRGDHYILVLIDQAVDLRPKQWWQFWR